MLGSRLEFPLLLEAFRPVLRRRPWEAISVKNVVMGVYLTLMSSFPCLQIVSMTLRLSYWLVPDLLVLEFSSEDGGTNVELPSLNMFSRLFARDDNYKFWDLLADHPFVELSHNFLDVCFDLIIWSDCSSLTSTCEHCSAIAHQAYLGHISWRYPMLEAGSNRVWPKDLRAEIFSWVDSSLISKTISQSQSPPSPQPTESCWSSIQTMFISLELLQSPPKRKLTNSATIFEDPASCQSAPHRQSALI